MLAGPGAPATPRHLRTRAAVGDKKEAVKITTYTRERNNKSPGSRHREMRAGEGGEKMAAAYRGLLQLRTRTRRGTPAKRRVRRIHRIIKMAHARHVRYTADRWGRPSALRSSGMSGTVCVLPPLRVSQYHSAKPTGLLATAQDGRGRRFERSEFAIIDYCHTMRSPPVPMYSIASGPW